MIRFILNFILFGIIFYLIWLFFPEAFGKLVGWVNDLYAWVMGQFDVSSTPKAPPPTHS